MITIPDGLGDMTALELVGVVVGTLAAIWYGAKILRAFVKWLLGLWPWLKAIVRFGDALVSLPGFITTTTEKLDSQGAQINEIHHEVHFNDGSSTKDAVTRTEQIARETSAKLGKHIEICILAENKREKDQP